MRMVAVSGSRVLTGEQARATVIDWSRAFKERQERQALIDAMARRPRKGDATNVRFAMRSVEQRIVRGLWVLEISQEPDGPRLQRRHGMQYMREHGDVDWRYEDAPGGKWGAPAPRPALPSAEEIDAAREAQGWITMLDDQQARLLAVAALTKRGDRSNRVLWERVKDRLRLPEKTPLRTLQDRYDSALRRIVAELTVRHLDVRC